MEVVAGDDRIVVHDDGAVPKPLKVLNAAFEPLHLVIDVLAPEQAQTSSNDGPASNDELNVALAEPPLAHSRLRVLGK